MPVAEEKFLTPLRVENQGPVWMLTDALVFEHRGGQIIAPSHFETDFASIPPLSTIAFWVIVFCELFEQRFPILWFLKAFALFVVIISYSLCCDNLIDAPATIHDFLYATQTIKRATADKILYRALRANQVALWKSATIYINVRLFGWYAWLQDQRKYHINSCPDLDPNTTYANPSESLSKLP